MSLCSIDGFATANYNDDLCHIYAFGREKATATINLYRFTLNANDAMTMSLGQMFDGSRESNALYNTLGSYSSTLGNENKSDNTGSLTLRADTVYNAINPEILPPEVNRNTVIAMMETSGIDDGGTYREILGTSGNAILECSVEFTDAKWLLYRDGYFVISGQKTDPTTGKPILRSNPDILNYDKNNKCVMTELQISPLADGSQDQVFRISHVKYSNVQYAEGNDANTYTSDYMLVSERKHAEKPMFEGFSDNQVDTVATTGTATIYTVNADYIIAIAGGGEVTVAGATIGDIAIVINTNGSLTGSSVAVSGTTVTGTSTTFTEQLGVGGKLILDGTSYTIDSIATDLSLELVESGAPASPSAFATSVGNTQIFKYNTTWINTPVTSTLGKGFRAWTSEYSNLLDGTGGTTGDVHFMSVKTAGISGAAVAGKYGTAFTIPAKVAIMNNIDRTAVFENYNYTA